MTGHLPAETIRPGDILAGGKRVTLVVHKNALADVQHQRIHIHFEDSNEPLVALYGERVYLSLPDDPEITA